MQISQKSTNIIENCRFCWMCRHICPIGNATGQERNTARARALSLSVVLKEGAPFSADIIDNLYECALCGACTHDCATGFDPVAFTKDARLAAALEGKMPSYVQKLLENIETTGNIFGEKETPTELQAAIAALDKRADTLLFLGKDAIYKTPKQAVAAIELMKKTGENFTVLADEPDSGYALDFLFGAADETKKTMADTAQILNGFKTVIAYDGADAKVFFREYKEWELDLHAKVRTFPSFIAEKIKDGRITPQKTDKKFTPQDSAVLMRELDEPDRTREILSACGTLSEMLLIQKDTVLAGNLIMNEYMPAVMKRVAERRWKDALRAGCENLVTASAAEYCLLHAYKPNGVNVCSIEEAVLSCL